MTKKKILLYISSTIIHNVHIRLLKKASKLGKVYVALTKDKQVKKFKGYNPELNYNQRKEVLESIKYVYRVLPSNFHIKNNYLLKHKIDYLIHGNDYLSSEIPKSKLIIWKRTKGISSTIIRKRTINNSKKKNN